MTDAVETMAWTNEVPWHGLGTQVAGNLTTDEMMHAAGLDWTVSKRKLQYQNGNGTWSPITDHFALTRDTDGRVFDVCGPAYTPVQNAEAFEFFREYVEAGEATMETAGSLRGGKIVWVLANLGKSFKLAGKDEVKGYLLMSQPHQQGKAQIIKGTSIRVVCMNTLGFALGQDEDDNHVGVVRRAHRGEFDAEARERAKQQLGIAREGFKEFAEVALKLSKIKIDRLRSAQLIAQIFGDGEELCNAEALELIIEEGSKATNLAIEALEHAPGAKLLSANNTAWGVLNAVTYTTDHLLRRTADARMYNAWFGRSSRLKEEAVEILNDL